eukprot:2842611-Prymnesium_polylepis.1
MSSRRNVDGDLDVDVSADDLVAELNGSEIRCTTSVQLDITSRSHSSPAAPNQANSPDSESSH